MKTLSDLPYDMLAKIAKKLKKFEDFTSFRSVSKSLRAAAKEEYFEGLRLRQGTPYLMLPVRDGNDDTRELYGLVEGESIVASVKVPKVKNKKCLESLGWLMANEEDGSMSLLEPFSGTKIPLPHEDTFPEYVWLEVYDEDVYFKKMVLSARPSETLDFVLMVIGGGRGYLAFWRLGDKKWNRIEGQPGSFCDVVYHGGGQFYAVSNPGTVWVFNLAGNNDNQIRGRIVTHINLTFGYGLGNVQPHHYIVKTVDDSLLVITRASPNRFQVYEVDIVTRTCTEIHRLGRSMAVFLGHNSTIAVDASKFPGTIIKSNHIYFTDNNYVSFHFYGQKVGGIYNLETGTVEWVYPGEILLSNVFPSTWITPCF